MLCSSPPAAPACGGANCLGFGFGPCWEICDSASGDYTLAHVDMLVIEPVRSTLLVGVIHQQIVTLLVGIIHWP
ncbi:hypothetical protein SLEP1_g54981 [Rubroshorea leprosula]|uniref:Secreted protein n=1 Tax=Rubroshorea leprosula TaxID=152421 RepID=A0AAV5MG80_9ROSI|nr:hypothetical protein SLEP1_g54981 [Rubroshorea leprosula]